MFQDFCAFSAFCFKKYFIWTNDDIIFKIKVGRGCRGAQSVKHPTLDFSSGYGLTVCESGLHVRLCTDSMEPAWDSPFPSLSAPPPFTLALSLSLSLSVCLKINK